MGLDIWLASKGCPTCGHQDLKESFSCTYNLWPMWFAVFPKDKCMVDIDGMSGKKSLTKLKKVIREMAKNPEKFKALDPPNGWGSAGSFNLFICNLITAAQENPDFIWSSCR